MNNAVIYNNRLCKKIILMTTLWLKFEEINRNSYYSIKELKLSVFEYIHFYNFNRPHSANNLLSPVQFEMLFCFFCLLY